MAFRANFYRRFPAGLFLASQRSPTPKTEVTSVLANKGSPTLKIAFTLPRTASAAAAAGGRDIHIHSKPISLRHPEPARGMRKSRRSLCKRECSNRTWVAYSTKKRHKLRGSPLGFLAAVAGRSTARRRLRAAAGSILVGYLQRFGWRRLARLSHAEPLRRQMTSGRAFEGRRSLADLTAVSGTWSCSSDAAKDLLERRIHL
mmetsp:Transcript_26067/g.60314  ORF Transcript_26067/g.60314 Transcript_26067/m.60314 type:complete len:202 (-) Transcript_26067:21-626(-)